MEPNPAVCEKPTHIELELENARLQKLVADLLVRNQGRAEVGPACAEILTRFVAGGNRCYSQASCQEA